MALPQFLLLEVRNAFLTCAKPRYGYYRQLSRTTPLARRTKSSEVNPAKSSRTSESQVFPKTDESSAIFRNDSTSSKELVPREDGRKAIDSGRRVPVPLKVLPKADLTPKLRLSPRERLHLEALTRTNPPVADKKVYRERILVYHHGHFRENFLAIIKVSTLVCAAGVTFIIAPAHVAAGTPLWLVGLIFVGGFIPAFAVNWLTKPMVSRIFLRIPPQSRHSAKDAMEFAHNVPNNAELEISFLRPWALEGRIQARLADLKAASSKIRPLTFKWTGPRVDKGSFVLPNPTEFYVQPKTAAGNAARDTIPGLWGNIYKRITGLEGDAVTKWKR